MHWTCDSGNSRGSSEFWHTMCGQAQLYSRVHMLCRSACAEHPASIRLDSVDTLRQVRDESSGPHMWLRLTRNSVKCGSLRGLAMTSRDPPPPPIHGHGTIKCRTVAFSMCGSINIDRQPSHCELPQPTHAFRKPKYYTHNVLTHNHEPFPPPNHTHTYTHATLQLMHK